MRALLVLAIAAFVMASSAAAAGPAKVFVEDTLPRSGASSVTITTQRPASFRVLLRVPTAGRAKLFLLGKDAPKGGALITTSNTAPTSCEGAAGSFYCKASYEPLPKGSYTWRITWNGRQPAHVELTVRW